jgi:hypothetical protein
VKLELHKNPFDKGNIEQIRQAILLGSPGWVNLLSQLITELYRLQNIVSSIEKVAEIGKENKGLWQDGEDLLIRDENGDFIDVLNLFKEYKS